MRFRLRLHDQRIYQGNPGGLVLEISNGYHVDAYSLNREDIAALNSLIVQLNSGVGLPIEAGSDWNPMETGEFPIINTGSIPPVPS